MATIESQLWEDLRVGDQIDLTFHDDQDVATLCVNLLRSCLMGYNLIVCGPSKERLSPLWDVLLKSRRSSATYSTHSMEYDDCIKCTQNSGQVRMSTDYQEIALSKDPVVVYIGAGDSDPAEYKHQRRVEEHAAVIVRVWK